MSTFYPAGRYRVKVVGASLGSAENGTPQIEMGLEILGFYDPAEGTFHAEQGPERTAYMTLTEGTLGTVDKPGWVYQTLLDLGWAGRSFDELQPLVGQVRDAECKHDSWDGKTTEKWSTYRRRGATAQRPLEQKTVRQLNTKFAALLRAGAKPQPPAQAEAPVRPGSPTSPVPAESAPARQTAEDDIPF